MRGAPWGLCLLPFPVSLSPRSTFLLSPGREEPGALIHSGCCYLQNNIPHDCTAVHNPGCNVVISKIPELLFGPTWYSWYFEYFTLIAKDVLMLYFVQVFSPGLYALFFCISIFLFGSC